MAPGSFLQMQGLDDTPAPSKLSGAAMLGIGALVLAVGYLTFSEPKKMRANASRRKKRSSKKARSAAMSRMMTGRRGGTKVARVYAEQAGYIKRDVGNGRMAEADITASLDWTWDDQKAYFRSRGIKTKAQFVKGVKAKL